MTVAFPAYSAATARLIASVVLPAPPFWDAIATVLKAKTPLPAPIKQELRHTSRSHGNAGLRFAAHTGIRELHGFGPVAWQKRAKRAPHPADRLRGFAAAVFIFSLNPRVFRLR